MIHRAIFGSIERFFGILIENCAGAFPLWLAPVQCRIIPVTDAVLDYANDVVAQMREAGIRVQLDSGGFCLSLTRIKNTCCDDSQIVMCWTVKCSSSCQLWVTCVHPDFP